LREGRLEPSVGWQLEGVTQPIDKPMHVRMNKDRMVGGEVETSLREAWRPGRSAA